MRPRNIMVEHTEGEELTLLAQLRHPNGSLLVLNSFTPTGGDLYTVRVFDTIGLSGDGLPKYTTTGNNNLVIQPAAVVDGYWDIDAVGYTFLDRLSNTDVGWQGGHTYVVEYALLPTLATPTITDPIYLGFEVSVFTRLSP